MLKLGALCHEFIALDGQRRDFFFERLAGLDAVIAVLRVEREIRDHRRRDAVKPENTEEAAEPRTRNHPAFMPGWGCLAVNGARA